VFRGERAAQAVSGGETNSAGETRIGRLRKGKASVAKQLKTIQIFVASPGDVAKEKQALAEIVARLDRNLASHLCLRLELKEWRQVAPGMGRPEDVILDQLPVESWDLFIGILWLRFGTPSGTTRAGENFDSGTEEEFRLAYQSWQQTQRPRIGFYRCMRPPKDPSVDTDQLGKVQAFFEGFHAAGRTPGLVQDFRKTDDFAERVERDLSALLLNGHDASEAAVPSPAAPRSSTSPSSNGWRNPFIVGLPITDPADFFGRERELDFCLQRLRGMQSVSILGERRIGKTSLLRYLISTLPERLGAQFRGAFLDLTRPNLASVEGALVDVQRQIGLENPAPTLTGFAERLASVHAAGQRVVVAFDEAEMFVRLPTEFNHDFCESLRALASAGQLALLTASRLSLREMHEHGALVSPLYNVMGVRRLDEFTEEEAREFVALPREGVAFAADQVEEILRHAGRHPLRLQVFSFHAAQAARDGRDDRPEVWDEAQAELDSMLGLPSIGSGV
jgi:uncharacterized protein